MYEVETQITSGKQTLGEIVEHVYFLADEEPNAVFSEKDVKRLLNMGFRKVINEVGYYTRIASANVSAGNQRYPLLDPILDGNETAIVQKVTLIDVDGNYVSDLSAGTFREYDTSSGTPTSFSVVGDALYLSPVPSEAGRIRVWYKSQLPKFESDTSVPPLSDDQIECAEYYALWQMKLKDDEVNVSDRWRDEFNERLRRLSNPRVGVYKA